MDFQTFKSKMLPILKIHKNIGIMVSGGFDSGLLLYCCSLIKKQEDLDVEFTAITVPRSDNSAGHSRRIVDWVNSIFFKNILIDEAGNPNLHHSMQVWSGVTDRVNKHQLILMGCTTNPSHLKNGPNRPRVLRRDVFQPFFELTKKDTVALALELGLTDLVKLSHTCTESTLLRCGKCWQCREREWGFEENNYTDIGTM